MVDNAAEGVPTGDETETPPVNEPARDVECDEYPEPDVVDTHDCNGDCGIGDRERLFIWDWDRFIVGVRAFGGSTDEDTSILDWVEDGGACVAPGSCLRLQEQSYVTC